MARRLSQKDYDQLVSSMRACEAAGYDGFVQLYNDMLHDHERRGTLPPAVADRLRRIEESAEEEDGR